MLKLHTITVILLFFPNLNIHLFNNSDAALINDVIIIDENRVVSSALDGEINVWNSNNGDNLQTWKAHSSPTKLALLDNGQLVTGSLDAIGSIKIWNPNTG